MVRESADVDVSAVARLSGDGFWKRAWDGIQYGWQFILDLLVILITIWPLYLIVIVGLILFKLFRPLLNRIFNDSLKSTYPTHNSSQQNNSNHQTHYQNNNQTDSSKEE